jgi:hypothetical protein
MNHVHSAITDIWTTAVANDWFLHKVFQSHPRHLRSQIYETRPVFSACEPVPTCQTSLKQTQDELAEWKWYSQQGSQAVHLLREDSKRLTSVLETMLMEVRGLLSVSTDHTEAVAVDTEVVNLCKSKDFNSILVG